ncbi:MAG: hypothetical protein KatS3mg110_0439 [Pirellulaceae bacterium]|nr:MAG: hypothetical protein KatS3mg110_0439 [Pirellulaceae bacterium]
MFTVQRCEGQPDEAVDTILVSQLKRDRPRSLSVATIDQRIDWAWPPAGVRLRPDLAVDHPRRQCVFGSVIRRVDRWVLQKNITVAGNGSADDQVADE